MGYVRQREEEAEASALGCGPGCGCGPCRRRAAGLGEWYEPDEDDGAPAAPGGVGAWEPGLGASVSVAPSAAGPGCTAEERRIHPIREPPRAELVRVEAAHLADPRVVRLLARPAHAALLALREAARRDGLPPRMLTVVSGYRSVAHQRELWERALRRYGGDPKVARRWVAPPGGSPHHTGRAVDFFLGPANDSRNVAALRATPAYRWLVCNAARFGFHPYAAEPWHWEHNPQVGGAPVPASPAPARPPPRPRAPAPTPAGGPPAGKLTGFTPAEEKALRITTTFETGRPLGFGGLTGDFDGMGLSFGLLQWNVGTGSLQPLLRRLDQAAPARFDAAFGPDAGRLRTLLDPRRPRGELLRFARSINTPDRRTLVEPWRGRFQRLAADPAFQRIELEVARKRMDAAQRSARALGLRTERGLALIFDNVTQNGGGWLKPARKALIDSRGAAEQVRLGRPLTERERLAVIANAVADTVLPRWREDVRRRRLTIVNGAGTVHGQRLDLGRQFGLTDAPL